MENNNKMKDFISSAVIFILSLYVLFEGYNIYTRSGKMLYLSPALIPLMLGTILLVLSIVLFTESLKEGGLQARAAELKAWSGEVKADRGTMRMLVGVVLMGLYTFVLLGMLPFWLATFLFMLLLMYFLEDWLSSCSRYASECHYHKGGERLWLYNIWRRRSGLC